MTADLVEAARFERDRRLQSYPSKIAEGGDAEQLCLDYQCWVAIAEWCETGRFFSFAGGADPERDDAPTVRWPELVAAAKRALHQVERKLAGEGWLDGMPETPTARRRFRLLKLHQALELRAESIAILNAQIRAPRQKGIAA